MPVATKFETMGSSAEGDLVLPREHPSRSQEEISDAFRANLERGCLESEERFRQIVEGLNDVVCLTNAGGTQVLFVNAAYDRIWGRPRERLYANPLAYLEGVHPDDRQRVRDAMAAQPRGSHSIEFRVVRPTGEVRWVWSRGYPVLDAEGRIYRVGSLVEDITENRQIIESHERLIRGFTHDIKNPLGAADGHLALLEMGIHGDVPEQQAESLRRARGAIRAALDLIAQLLKIERAQSGQVEIHRERFDLAALTSYAAEGFRAAAAAKRLDLELLPARPGDSLVIETDPALVRQILANLISNAVKYTQSGGHISVRAHVASDAETPRRGRWMAVDVADNGPGIPLAKQGMLFHEFARFDPGAAEGTGIGLAISQRLAGVLGATITFTSTPGVGSTFTLWIPDEASASLAS